MVGKQDSGAKGACFSQCSCDFYSSFQTKFEFILNLLLLVVTGIDFILFHISSSWNEEYSRYSELLEESLSSLHTRCASQREVSVHEKADGALPGCNEIHAGSPRAGCPALGSEGGVRLGAQTHARTPPTPAHVHREAHGRLLTCSVG